MLISCIGYSPHSHYTTVLTLFDAIVDVSLGGQEFGNAVADILTGKVTPSGKLSTTWAYKYEDYPTKEGITTLEVPGEESSASCLQSVKANADVLLMRPKNGKGGLEPLMRVMEYCNIAYRNLNRFLIYIFCVQIMRLIAIMLPMMFGEATDDGRHIVMLSMIFDIFAFLLFMMNSRRAGASIKNVKKMYAEETLKDIIKKYKNILFCSVLGGVLVVVLPAIFDSFNLFGGYQYKEEFTYLSLMLIQLVTVATIYTFDLRNKSVLKHLFTRVIFLIEIATFVIFTALSFLITPVGDFIGLEVGFVTLTPFYFLLTVVPAFAFTVCYIVMHAMEGEGGAQKKQKVISNRKKPNKKG